jgi:hypothetical protein
MFRHLSAARRHLSCGLHGGSQLGPGAEAASSARPLGLPPPRNPRPTPCSPIANLVLGLAQLVRAAGQQVPAAIQRAPLHRVRGELGVHHLQCPQRPRLTVCHAAPKDSMFTLHPPPLLHPWRWPLPTPSGSPGRDFRPACRCELLLALPAAGWRQDPTCRPVGLWVLELCRRAARGTRGWSNAKVGCARYKA